MWSVKDVRHKCDGSATHLRGPEPREISHPCAKNAQGWGSLGWQGVKGWASPRKLLHAIFGMFKYDAPFDGAKVYPALTLAVQPEVDCAA